VRARWQVVGLLLLVSCEVKTHERPDALPDATGTPPTFCVCTAIPLYHATCGQGAAETRFDCYSMGAGTSSMCYEKYAGEEVQCTSGCAVTGFKTVAVTDAQASQLKAFVSNASVLCAETPVAQVGDACDSSGSHPCLPTRAQLAADGTVASQSYLACAETGQCVAAAAPVIAGYLQPCDPATLTSYGVVDANGAVASYISACLLAWNSNTQAITSGRTISCIGDWECPEGSLCDDMIVDLMSPSQRLNVCKPGPRGVLTPGMLSP
jgi:hypothetical protein